MDHLRREDADVVLTLADEVRKRADRDQWTSTEELLAQVHELLQLMRAEHLAGLGVKAGSLPKLHRIPRPGDPPEETGPKTVSPSEFAMLMRGG